MIKRIDNEQSLTIHQTRIVVWRVVAAVERERVRIRRAVNAEIGQHIRMTTAINIFGK